MKLLVGKHAIVAGSLALVAASALAGILVLANSGSSVAAATSTETPPSSNETPANLAFTEEATTTTRLSSTTETSRRFTTTERTTFENCSEAAASGLTRIQEDEAGYSSELDRDNDGIACEEEETPATESPLPSTPVTSNSTNATQLPQSSSIPQNASDETTTTSPSPAPNQPTSGNAVEVEIGRLVNQLRTNPTGPLARQAPIPQSCPLQPNLLPLQINSQVSTVLSRDWSTQMANNGILEHRPLSQQRSILESTGVSFSTWGENIAFQMGFRNGRGQTDQQIAQRFFEGWRESDSHFCNMTNPDFTAAGIGHFFDASNDKDWATQNFYG